MQERCDNCRFYKSYGENFDDGECRRSPPQLIDVSMFSNVGNLIEARRRMPHLEYDKHLHQVAASLDESINNAVFDELAEPWAWRQPTVSGDDWCGEWQQQPTSPPTAQP